MTPVISPWVFYVTYICSNLSLVAFVVVGIIIACGVLALITGLWEDFIDQVKPKSKRILLTFFSICLVITIFCPNESTITKMIVAQNVTYERVEMVGDTVQDVYEDIISLVDGNNEEAVEE